jgi:hypothetical protein
MPTAYDDKEVSLLSFPDFLVARKLVPRKPNDAARFRAQGRLSKVFKNTFGSYIKWSNLINLGNFGMYEPIHDAETPIGGRK